MKIAINLSLAVQMLAFSEGVLLAEKSGIARETAVDVLTHSVIGSPMVQYRGPFVLDMPDEAWFNVNMMQKDMLLALEMGRQVDVPLPTTAVTNEMLTAARGMGLAESILRCCSRFWRACLESQNDHSDEPGSRRRRPRSRTIGSHVPADGDDPSVRRAVNDLYTRALMPGLAHLYIGEEAVAVGVCEALRGRRLHHQHPSRPRALPGQRGVSRPHVRRAARAREAGYCKGKGGSMHIADPATGNLGANAIVGGSAGIATGAAFSAKHLGTGRVVVCFFGEGALGQGVLYEVMNMAQLWKLPVIYVCENNMYNEYTHYSETTAGDILAQAGGVRSGGRERGRPGRARRVRSGGAVSSTRARQGEGPAFLLCNTYRFRGHHVGRHQPRILPAEAGRTALEDRARSHQAPRRLADRPETSPTRRCSTRSRRK